MDEYFLVRIMLHSGDEWIIDGSTTMCNSNVAKGRARLWEDKNPGSIVQAFRLRAGHDAQLIYGKMLPFGYDPEWSRTSASFCP